MKNPSKFAIMAFIGLTVFSCKDKGKNEKTDVETVEEVTQVGLPNTSDIHFENALSALEDNNSNNASQELKMGTKALAKESKDLSTKAKTTLEVSIKKINNIAVALKNNKTITINNLKEALLNAELAVDHDYLVDDNVYLLTEPKKAYDKAIIDNFSSNMKQLESTNEALNDEGNNSGKKLYEEGVKLQKQYDDWLLKVKDHNIRSNEHLQNDYIETININ